MTILHTIAANPFLSLLASVGIVMVISPIRAVAGCGADVPHSEPNAGDE